MRLLIIKRDKLGDLLLTRPVLDRAKALVPDAEIHLLANDYNAWVASDHPAVARTWIYPRVRSDGRIHPLALLRQIPLGWQLRRQRFDWAFVMGGDESHRAIRRALRTGAQRAYVVIGLGARRAKKQPTPAQVARWSTRIHAAHGLATVLMWTPGASNNPAYPGDDALAQAVLDQRLPHVLPFRGPIEPALGLIFSARTSIIPDSGLTHFAAASPGGVLGLFADPGDSAPASRWAPLGSRARHLEAPARIADVPDDDIFAALAPLLA